MPGNHRNTTDPYRYNDGPKTAYYATFDPVAFDRLVKANGLFFHWQRAIACSCRLNTETDQPNPVCAHCTGSGWSYVNPEYAADATDPAVDPQVGYYNIQAIFANMSLDPTIQNVLGSWTMGSAMLTVPGWARITFRDRFIAKQQVMGWSESLIRGAGADVPIGRVGRTPAVQATALRYEPFEINYIEQSDGVDRTIYTEGTDYELIEATASEPVKLSWLTAGPAIGSRYSLHYNCHPIWVVDDAAYGLQHARGQQAGIAGRKDTVQFLPTTFKACLDFLTDRQGT